MITVDIDKLENALRLAGVSVLRNQQVLDCQVDILIDTKNIAIDINQLKEDSEFGGKYSVSHKNKRDAMYKAGYSYLCFREDELSERFDIVKSIILFKTGNFKTVYARKCSIRRLGGKEANTFFDVNHLMGKGKGECFALSCEDEVLSAIRIVKSNQYIDVSRFSTRNGFQVVGGLSRLLKHVIRLYNPKGIISFVDGRYGNGQSLTTLGFKLETNSPSFKWTDFLTTCHRMRFKSSSGRENGYYKIWDCGQMRFFKNLGEEDISASPVVAIPNELPKKRNLFECEFFKGIDSFEARRNKLVEFGRNLYSTLGRALVVRDFRGFADRPPESLICGYFNNSFVDYIKAAGIDELEKNRLKSEFIDHAKYLATKLERQPVVKDFKGKFCHSNARKLFGTYGNFLEAAGFVHRLSKK